MLSRNTTIKKALGQDWFVVSLLNDKDQGHHLRKKLVRMLNEDKIPNYLRASRLVMISKKKKTSAQHQDIGPFCVDASDEDFGKSNKE